MAHASVTIQITPESKPAIPFWMGEVAAFAQMLTHEGILTAIAEQVRFARARFGQYDLIDFVVVLIGYMGVFAYPPETSTPFRGDMQKPPCSAQ
jgi:hypothetical protein